LGAGADGNAAPKSGLQRAAHTQHAARPAGGVARALQLGLVDVTQLGADEIGELQILEKQIQELRSRQREGELIHQIALSGFATGPLPTAARTLDTVTLDELLVAGVHGFPV